MSHLNFPSLQHMCKHWANDESQIAKSLIRLKENPPLFSYHSLNKGLYDILVLGVPSDQVARGIASKAKTAAIASSLLEILPIAEKHFRDVAPCHYLKIDTKNYRVGNKIQIPY